MFSIKNLKIKGFRGYVEEKEFFFETPVILLFGENHRGKSSALNAIEWCLFGNECIGKNTGIRERIDWEIRNRNLPSKDEVFVELELEDENNSVYKVLRRWVSKTKDELEITLSDGQLLKEQGAKEKIAQLLKSSFRDFLTTVYQHQEAIRAIFTQEPKDRNDALDRLLGLSDYRNILSGIESTYLNKRQNELEDSFKKFKDEIEVALRTRQHDLKEKREELIKKGLKEDHINEKGALEIAKAVRDELSKFVSDIGLTLTDLLLPENWKELKEKFLNVAVKEITRFRSEMPDVKRQTELHNQNSQITSLYSDYESKNRKLKTVKEKIDKFIKEHGNEEKLNNIKSNKEKQITFKEKEMKEVNTKGKTISDAIDYLKMEGIDKNICPVCGEKTPDLLTHLEEEWNKKYKEQMGKIKDEIEKLKKDLDNVEILLKQLKELSNDFENAKGEITEVNKKIIEQLKREITEEDDPLVLLNNKLNENQDELNKLEQYVKSRQEKLNDIQAKEIQIQLIVDILNLEEKKKIVEEIKQTPEYKQMEELKDQMAILVNEVNKIKEAINAASFEDAKNKITSAGKMISDLFCKITNNPAVSKIELSVNTDRTGKNNYEFKDQHGKDLTPVLSQGDLNAFALSIFFGLSSSLNNQFGFTMLDDPSQSLSSEHKEKFIGILDAISEKRTIILSTMDKELQELALSKLTKVKTKYIFTGWAPENGPEIKGERV